MSRSVRGVAEAPDKATSQNLDAIGEAISDIPETFYTEGVLHTITFTSGSGLDQTRPHKLSGIIKGAYPVDIFEASGTDRVVRYKVLSPLTDKTHFRMVASGPCVAQIWAWR